MLALDMFAPDMFLPVMFALDMFAPIYAYVPIASAPANIHPSITSAPIYPMT
jgi:hypothetical protein